MKNKDTQLKKKFEAKDAIKLWKVLRKLDEVDYYKAFNLIEDFIHSALEEQRKEVIGEIKEGLLDCYIVYDNADYQKPLEKGYLIEDVKELLGNLLSHKKETKKI